MQATSFLGSLAQKRNSDLSVIGKIRSGTKVLTKRASENPGIAAIYQRSLNGAISFQDAAKEIEKRFNERNPFFPRNTPWFHAHAWDMEGGMKISQQILDLYGEKREGDDQPHLYRFPVVFPDIGVGNIDSAMDGGMSVQGGGANTIRYRSKYGLDGRNLCVFLPEVVRSQDTKRKQFARRELVVRGECVPNTCAEFASGACRFSGKLRFYIPGIHGAGVFELSTGSQDAVTDIYLRLAGLIKQIGMLPSYTPSGEPVFWLSKMRERRTYFDEQGNKKQGEQWVPKLESLIEVPRVIRILEQRKQGLLSAPTATPDVPGLPSAWVGGGAPQADAPVRQAMPDVMVADANGVIVPEYAEMAAPAAPAAAPVAKPLQSPQPSGQDGSLDDLLQKFSELGIANTVAEWASLQYGDGWMEPALAPQVCEKLTTIFLRFNNQTGVYLRMLTTLLVEEVSWEELARPYVAAKWGSSQFRANLPKIAAHIEELFSQGREVAIAHMTSTIEAGQAA